MRIASRPYWSSAPCSRRMLPTDLAIFSVPISHHAVVHPDPRERRAARRLGLGDLVLVVREDEVGAAAVDLEVHAEDLPRPSPSTRCASRAGPRPRASSQRVSSPSLARLPEREVLRRSLERGGVVALALLHLVERAVRELAVAPGSSRRGSRRRRPPRRRGPTRSGPRSAPRSRRSSRWPCGSLSGRPEAEPSVSST